MRRGLTRDTFCAGVLVLTVAPSPWSAPAAQGAGANQSVAYDGQIFAVPRTWLGVPVGRACTGIPQTLVVGNGT